MSMKTCAPPRYEKATIKDATTNTIKQIRKLLTKENFDEGLTGSCLVISGQPGIGKSWGIWGLVNDFRALFTHLMGEKEYMSRFSGYPSPGKIGVMTAEWYDEYLQAPFDWKKAILDEVQNVFVLCIDDLGMEAATERNAALIESIIDYRYNREYTTIITTNLPLAKFKERYSERIMDRLREWGTWYESNETSMRGKKRLRIAS